MKKTLLVLIALALAGCKPTDDKVISIAEKEMTQRLKDPGSAIFKESAFYPDKESGSNESNGYVCGLVNAKNSFGGYIGFQPYYIHVSVETRFFIPQFGVLHGASDPNIITETDIEKAGPQLIDDYIKRCPKVKS